MKNLKMVLCSINVHPHTITHTHRNRMVRYIRYINITKIYTGHKHTSNSTPFFSHNLESHAQPDISIGDSSVMMYDLKENQNERKYCKVAHIVYYKTASHVLPIHKKRGGGGHKNA